MNQTTTQEQEERQKATQVYQKLTQSEMTLFESFVNVAFVLFFFGIPYRIPKKKTENACKPNQSRTGSEKPKATSQRKTETLD